MTRIKDMFDYLDYLDTCTDNQFLKFIEAMEKRGYKFVTQYVHDYDYPHVTHCKDCKHFNKQTCPMVVSLPVKSEQRTSGWVETFRNTAEDYCSRAERKEP